jgi:hypothetical protein
MLRADLEYSLALFYVLAGLDKNFGDVTVYLGNQSNRLSRDDRTGKYRGISDQS